MTDNKIEAPKNILEQAMEATQVSRAADYGHPLDDFTRAAQMLTGLFGWPITADDVPLIMICIKLSRQKNKHKDDNLVDIAGYAATLEMLRDERAVREFNESTFGPGGTVLTNVDESKT